MTADIRSAIEKCETCARAAPQQQRQPLQQPDAPKTAWSNVSTDIFTMDTKNYLVTVVGLSDYFKVDRLYGQSSHETILKLRIHFARYGAPAIRITDNGPQFKSAEFAQFAKEWRFEYRTSSPHYPRRNGQAEAAIKVAKSILTKCKRENVDVYQAFLDYRNTPRVATSMSPTQVLMNRSTRTTTLPQKITQSEAEKDACHNKQR